MLRPTPLAFRAEGLLELVQAIGAESRTKMTRNKVPGAMPTLLDGLNQCILLSLTMLGTGGLGAEVARGLTRMKTGVGLADATLLARLSSAALARVRA